MCTTIVINNRLPDHKDISSPKELEDHFKAKCIPYDDEFPIIPDACLCQVDIEKTFDAMGVKYEYDASGPSYFVPKIKCKNE